MFRMKRREFITLLGGAAMAWPLAARAQQVERVRRVGVLSNLAADDPEAQARNTAFLQALAQLGWTNGQNVRIDLRWASGDPGRFHKYADELLALAPDVVLGAAAPSIVALQRATRTVPIVFVGVGDPVAAGFVESLARPGGNTTGFTPYEYGIAAKWLELLKEIAPNTTRAAVIREPSVSGIGQFAAMQGVAPSLGVELSPIDPRDAGAIERAVDSFARKPNGALIVTGSPLTGVHRNLIFALAARHRLPAIYPFRYCRRRRSMGWRSTSRPRGRLDSPCRRCCSPAPTR